MGKVMLDFTSKFEQSERIIHIVRVTGYAARFISLPRIYQEEFVTRTNFNSIL